jgi:protein-S-isoprenylcysteine O-methyltransferase Ste14
MRIKTTRSVVIRLLLWAVLLIGGTVLSVWLDMRDEASLLTVWWWHAISAPIGLGLGALAFRAAATGGRALAEHGKASPQTPRLETDRLVTTGIYAHMRHPMLFGLALMPMATAFLVGSPSFITIVAPLETLFIIIMVLVFEEWECRRKFGPAYRDYSDRVPAVCWRPACLKKLLGF